MASSRFFSSSRSRTRKPAAIGLIAVGFVACRSAEDRSASSDAKVYTDASTLPSARAEDVPTETPPTREGCVRGSASLESIENDFACVVARADESLTREAMRQIALELRSETITVPSGSALPMQLVIKNVSSSDADLVFEAQPVGAGARPDWTRLAGVPELRAPGREEGYRVSLSVRTSDDHDRAVDGLPSVPAGAGGSIRFLRVRLRAGGKLTHAFPWWALRIPTPMPIFRDDAGHRIVPKTAPLPLTPGVYVVSVPLPLHGVSPVEATATTRVTVEKIEKPPKH